MKIDLEQEVAGEIKKNLAAQEADEIQAEITRQRQASFKSSMMAASRFDPSKFSQALQVQRQSGVPAKVAYDNWDKVDEIKQQDKMAGLFRDSPATAAALSKPEGLNSDKCNNLYTEDRCPRAGVFRMPRPA